MSEYNSWSYVYECFCALVSSFYLSLCTERLYRRCSESNCVTPIHFRKYQLSSSLSACFFQFFFPVNAAVKHSSVLVFHITQIIYQEIRIRCLFLASLHNIVNYGNRTSKRTFNNSALKPRVLLTRVHGTLKDPCTNFKGSLKTNSKCFIEWRQKT